MSISLTKKETESQKHQTLQKHDTTIVKFKTISWKDKWNNFFKNITVEPLMAFYIVPCVFANLATQNLNLEKACRVNLRYPQQVCDALTDRRTENYTFQEEQVQNLVASMGIWKTILQSFLPSVFVMFIGSWSDRWGRRKPCMLFPIVGEFMTVISLMVCVYFFDDIPMEVAGFAEGFFPAITGGWVSMFTGVFSYIGDITTLEERTLRIGIANLFFSLSIPVGLALSGILYKKIGFYGVFSISAVMYIMAFIYGYKRIQESGKPQKSTATPPSGTCAFIKDFFDLHHITETFNVVFKKGESNRRSKVLVLMFVVMVVVGPFHGELAVSYLFTRYRFNWDEVDFSIFSTYSMLTNLLGSAISVGIFSHVLKIDDAIIGIYSCMSKILSSFVYGLAKTPLIFYLGPILEILNGTSLIATRAIASKLVPSEELGKVNSILGACDALMPLVYGPMYNVTYAATINWMPGAFYILGGFLTIPAVLIFIWMYLQHRKEGRNKKKGPPEKRSSISIIADAIFSTAPKEIQIGLPIEPHIVQSVEKTTKKENIDGNGVINEVFDATMDVEIETLTENKDTTNEKDGIKNLTFKMEE